MIYFVFNLLIFTNELRCISNFRMYLQMCIFSEIIKMIYLDNYIVRSMRCLAFDTHCTAHRTVCTLQCIYLGALKQGGRGYVSPILKSRGTYVLAPPPPTFTTTFILISWSSPLHTKSLQGATYTYTTYSITLHDITINRIRRGTLVLYAAAYPCTIQLNLRDQFHYNRTLVCIRHRMFHLVRDVDNHPGTPSQYRCVHFTSNLRVCTLSGCRL